MIGFTGAELMELIREDHLQFLSARIQLCHFYMIVPVDRLRPLRVDAHNSADRTNRLKQVQAEFFSCDIFGIHVNPSQVI